MTIRGNQSAVGVADIAVCGEILLQEFARQQPIISQLIPSLALHPHGSLSTSLAVDCVEVHKISNVAKAMGARKRRRQQFTSSTTILGAAEAFTDAADGLIFRIKVKSGKVITPISFFPQERICFI